MHHLNGCSLNLYIDEENRSHKIHYQCLTINMKRFQRDLSQFISHFQLVGRFKNIQSIELILSNKSINFPVLLKSINENKGWSKDFKKNFDSMGRKGYLDLIANVIESSGYIKKLSLIFSQYGCTPQLYRSGIMDFMEYHSDNNYPAFYLSTDLIKYGLINEQEATKKAYPMIDMLSLSCAS